ncbi:MAG: hypothetical protein IH621_16570 [Krumholzibacteria bacterium]|nr:hypothetical protein [Candidatus Krumholzibacteria bacterium]
MDYRTSIAKAAIVLIAVVSMVPADGHCETAVFQYDTFEWTGGQLRQPSLQLPVDLDVELVAVTDVRISFAGISHEGTGYCCQGPDCVDLECDAALVMWFTEADSVRARAVLPGEGVEYSAQLDFEVYRCGLSTWPSCAYFPLESEPWGFLLDGSATLWLQEDDATACGTKCSAYVDLTLLTVEVDYEVSVPVEIRSWGSVRASYR